MKKFAMLAAIGGLAMSGPAFAQSPAGSTTAPAPAANAPAANAPANMTVITPPTQSISFNDAEAKAWIDKTVYSSDGKNVGEVAAFARDASGKVTEMHADVGGFLGLGETRVRLMPGDFTLSNDRVVLNLSSDAVKSLPHLPK